MRWLVALLLVTPLVCAGCNASGIQGAPGAGEAEMAGMKEGAPESHLPRARVYLRDAFGGTHPLQVEVATTPDARQRGLMYRHKLPAGTGMLFLFPEEAVQSFWMKNTLIPLDMLFIDRERRVVGIIHRAEPHTLTPRTVGSPSQYVLEVPGGWCEEKGIREGSRVDMEGVSGLHVR